jgi:hypothetical protein
MMGDGQYVALGHLREDLEFMGLQREEVKVRVPASEVGVALVWRDHHVHKFGSLFVELRSERLYLGFLPEFAVDVEHQVFVGVWTDDVEVGLDEGHLVDADLLGEDCLVRVEAELLLSSSSSSRL